MKQFHFLKQQTHDRKHRFRTTSSNPELTANGFTPTLGEMCEAAKTNASMLRRPTVLASILLIGGIAALAWGHDSTARSDGAKQVDVYVPPLARSADRTQADHPAPSDAPLDQMSVLLSQMAAWLAENFELPTTTRMPRVELVAPAQITALRYGSLLSQTNSPGQGTTSAAGGSVVAVYIDARQVIYLPEGWRAVFPADQSVLVHELVHHMQNRAGLTYECPQQREKLAYQAQARWLERFGSSLEKEFDLDPLSLFVRSSCF